MNIVKRYVALKNQSIETSGITKDYQVALCEYIWNGFEAKATTVWVDYTANDIGGVESISVKDNGDGICYETLPDTFGSFMASLKSALSTQLKSKTNKGKGRFAFNAFSTEARWNTVYKKDGIPFKYSITIDNIEKNAFDPTAPIENVNIPTGTTVTFYNIQELTIEDMDFSSLEGLLLMEFSWYLFLNQDRNIQLYVNGLALDYTKYIDKALSEKIEKDIEGEHFSISLIVWKEKIKEKFCVYYIDKQNRLITRETTTFNRNTVDFNHSAYVTSSYFDDYIPVSPEIEGQAGMLGYKKGDKVMKALQAFLQTLIDEKLRKYLLEKSETEIEKMRERGSFPRFSCDFYGQLREKDFISVTKELYCIESRIFYKLSPVQEKSLLGFLNLLLSSEERENVLTIIEEIVNLSEVQREDFAKILQKTHLENILDSIKLIESRYAVVEGLKALIYDFPTFTNERDHIQKIVGNHYWLFGEKYNLVSADARMQKALEQYIYILDGKDEDVKLSEDPENDRRMDIFMARKRLTEDSYEANIEENIIVELKAPSIKLTKKIYRQIEDYMSFIVKQNRFNSQLRRWRFISVCKEVDDDIKGRYVAFRDKGKRFLVYQQDNYEIYAMTWDDVFKDFELRHGFILDKLKYDCEQLSHEVVGEQYEGSRDLSNTITKKLVAQ